VALLVWGQESCELKRSDGPKAVGVEREPTGVSEQHSERRRPVLVWWTGGASGGHGRPGSLCSRRFSSVSVSQVATELHVLHVLVVHLRLLQVHSEAQNSVSSTAGQRDILTQTVETWLGGSRTIPPPAMAEVSLPRQRWLLLLHAASKQ
jgi:hypothetical protein